MSTCCVKAGQTRQHDDRSCQPSDDQSFPEASYNARDRGCLEMTGPRGRLPMCENGARQRWAVWNWLACPTPDFQKQRRVVRRYRARYAAADELHEADCNLRAQIAASLEDGRGHSRGTVRCRDSFAQGGCFPVRCASLYPQRPHDNHVLLPFSAIRAGPGKDCKLLPRVGFVARGRSSASFCCAS